MHRRNFHIHSPIIAFLTSLIVLILPLFSGSSHASVYFSGCNNETIDAVNLAFEQQVAELVNLERDKNGLPPLKLITELTDAARHHAADMKQDDYFEHDSYDLNGTVLQMVCKWNKRLAKFYSGGTLGENIAWGYGSPASVMDGWMNSPGHRNNILSANYREIGVGYYSRNWVQDFGSRFDTFPLVINGEATLTESPTVQLYIYNNGWTEMRLRNDNGDWGDWQPYQSTLQWTLANTPGTRIVSVEMRNATKTGSSNDSIEYVAPDGATPVPSPTSSPTPSPTSVANVLIGQIALQGRPVAPHSSWQIPLQVNLTAQNTTDPAKSFTPVSDASGRFTLIDPPHGNYSIAVRGEHTLWNVLTTTIQPDLNEVTFGTLYEGDIIADNHVNLIDFSALAVSYSTCSGQADFQTAADLDGDACIGDGDVNLVRQNFDRRGDTAPGALSFSVNAADTNNDVIEIAQITETPAGTMIFVTLKIDGQPSDLVNGGTLYFNFDSNKLKAIALSPSSTFKVDLANHIDNAMGQADISAGILGKGVQTPFEVATIAFEALTDITTTSVTLNMSAERQTDLAGGGKSVLSMLRNNGLVFESEISIADQFVYLPLVAR